jgi:hypothetical protein
MWADKPSEAKLIDCRSLTLIFVRVLAEIAYRVSFGRAIIAFPER